MTMRGANAIVSAAGAKTRPTPTATAGMSGISQPCRKICPLAKPSATMMAMGIAISSQPNREASSETDASLGRPTTSQASNGPTRHISSPSSSSLRL